MYLALLFVRKLPPPHLARVPRGRGCGSATANPFEQTLTLRMFRDRCGLNCYSLKLTDSDTMNTTMLFFRKREKLESGLCDLAERPETKFRVLAATACR